MLKKISRTFSIARCFGWENIPHRLLYLGKKRSGWLVRQTSPGQYTHSKYQESVDAKRAAEHDLWHGKQSSFFPMLSSDSLRELVPTPVWNEHVTTICESAIKGKYPFFSHWQGELGWPPDFNRDPVNELDWSIADHWTKTTCSETPRNDIKLVWEASRLTLAYYFAREFRYTNDERWAECFWQLIDEWIIQNPVNQTVAWECAQEVTFRLMAVLWGVFCTIDSEAATPARAASVHQLVWQSGKRIDATTEYGISQENNHAISEATGLWTIGLLFPEFREADRWKTKGRAILERESRRQIYEYGSYVQQSFSYHRVMLDDLVWAIQLGAINNEPLPTIVTERFSAATNWLSMFVDENNGRVPNYGANDGANVLPLSCTDYLDYRPILRAAQTVAGINATPCPDPLLNEKALWLTGDIPQVDAKGSCTHWSATDGGYHLLKTGDSRLMIRCCNYRDRPSHADMLHVDLWYRGVNILRDSGSFRYHHEDPELKAYFPSVRAHNTVQVLDYEQMTKGPGFLWLDWPKTECTIDGDGSNRRLECKASFTGEGHRYSHVRTIMQTGDVFEVIDTTSTDENFRIRWHLCPDAQWHEVESGKWVGTLYDFEYEINVRDHDRVTMDSAWESLYYGEKQLHPVLVIEGKSQAVTTTFKPIPGQDKTE